MDEAFPKEGLLLQCEDCHCWRSVAFLVLKIPGLSTMLCILDRRSDHRVGWHLTNYDDILDMNSRYRSNVILTRPRYFLIVHLNAATCGPFVTTNRFIVETNNKASDSQ